MIDSIIDSFSVWTDAQGLKSKGRVKSIENISLEGIARLRELILELAVRGKLVPQDATDEPASVLLKRIEKEKEKLIKEGKLKKQALIQEIPKEEIPFELSNNWNWIRLQSLVTVLGDGLHGTPIYTPETNYYFINGNNLSNGKIEIKADTKTVSIDEIIKYKKVLNERTVLVSINGTLGNVAFYNDEEIMLGKSACYFNLSHNIYKHYIKLLLESPYFRTYAIQNSTGSTIKNLGLKAMNEFPIPLPPLSEQQRIVAKVDELMALCDKLESEQTANLKTHQTLVKTLLETLTLAADAEELQAAWERMVPHFDILFSTEDSIEQLKQTILQLAVMGKLVKQDPSDEPASELLKKIAKEKERLVKEGKLKKQTPLPAISEEEKQFALAKGWEWVRLQSLVTILGDGLHGTPEYTQDTDYYFINGNNLINGRIEIKSETKTVSKEEMLKYKKVLNERTVLVSINGTLGNVAFYNDEEIMLGKSACYFNLSEYVSKYYIKLIIDSPFFKEYAFKSSSGTTIKNLGLKAMNEFLIPLPPLSEQHRIVAKVDELFGLCTSLKERLQKVGELKVLLSKTVVEKAVG